MEVIGWSGRLTQVHYNFLTNVRRKLSPAYASAELLWYLSRSNKIDLLRRYAPQYINFSDDGDTAYGAYGYRIAHNHPKYDMLELAKQLLAGRQCVVSIWKPEDMGVSTKDLPCTLTWQFFERDGKLHMHCNMRSNDVWLGMPYDIYVNTCIQQLLACSCGLYAGDYVHTVGSMHLYDKNAGAAEVALDARSNVQQFVPMLDPIERSWAAVNLEKVDEPQKQAEWSYLNGILRDSVICCRCMDSNLLVNRNLA